MSPQSLPPKSRSRRLGCLVQCVRSCALMAAQVSASRKASGTVLVATTSRFPPVMRNRRDHVHRPTNAKLCPHLLESLTPVSLLWLPDAPGVRGRRLALRSCLSLESLPPVSLRWLQENQGQHRCQCGCGQVIDPQAWHYRRGIPRFTHGHHNRRGHWRVLQLREAGYLTISEVAKALGIGTTTLRRREGTVYPPGSPDRRDPGL